jgi:hypothetical protein
MDDQFPTLNRWLAAESAESAEGAESKEHEPEAEAAFGALLSGLERPAPAAGFAERVMLRWEELVPRLSPQRAPRVAAAQLNPFDRRFWSVSGRRLREWLGSRRSVWSDSRGLKLALAFLLGTTALGWLLVSSAFLLIWQFLGREELSVWIVRSLGALCIGLLDVWTTLQKLLLLQRVLSLPLGAPTVALALAFCLVISAAAFRYLQGTLRQERSWSP